MKRLLSIIMTAVMCMCMLTVLTGCSKPDNDYRGWDGEIEASCLMDNKKLFTEDQQRELDKKIQDKAQELEMNILIYVNGTFRSDSDTKPFCDQEYDNWFGQDTDGLMYYLDLSGKTPAYDYISTAGKAILLYENDRETIFSHMDMYLPSSGQEIRQDQIYIAIVEFLDQLSIYAERNISNSGYYYDSNKGTYIYYINGELFITHKKPLILWVRIWIVSALIGLLTALITFLVSKGHYKFKSKTNPSIYLSKDSVNYTQKSDMHLRTYQTRTRMSSSSGGGGSRGGGGGGGGSHGGGGHHR